MQKFVHHKHEDPLEFMLEYSKKFNLRINLRQTGHAASRLMSSTLQFAIVQKDFTFGRN